MIAGGFVAFAARLMVYYGIFFQNTVFDTHSFQQDIPSTPLLWRFCFAWAWFQDGDHAFFVSSKWIRFLLLTAKEK